MGGTYVDINELDNLHIDNEEDTHTSSENYEANGYGHDFEMPIISC